MLLPSATLTLFKDILIITVYFKTPTTHVALEAPTQLNKYIVHIHFLFINVVMKSSVVISLFVIGGSSWVLDFYGGGKCTSQGVGQFRVDEGPNYCATFDAPNAESVQVVGDGNTNTQLEFYQGGNCDGKMLGLQSTPGCLDFVQNGVGSVRTLPK